MNIGSLNLNKIASGSVKSVVMAEVSLKRSRNWSCVSSILTSVVLNICFASSYSSSSLSFILISTNSLTSYRFDSDRRVETLSGILRGGYRIGLLNLTVKSPVVDIFNESTMRGIVSSTSTFFRTLLLFDASWSTTTPSKVLMSAEFKVVLVPFSSCDYSSSTSGRYTGIVIVC